MARMMKGGHTRVSSGAWVVCQGSGNDARAQLCLGERKHQGKNYGQNVVFPSLPKWEFARSVSVPNRVSCIKLKQCSWWRRPQFSCPVSPWALGMWSNPENLNELRKEKEGGYGCWLVSLPGSDPGLGAKLDPKTVWITIKVIRQGKVAEAPRTLLELRTVTTCQPSRQPSGVHYASPDWPCCSKDKQGTRDRGWLQGCHLPWAPAEHSQPNVFWGRKSGVEFWENPQGDDLNQC